MHSVKGLEREGYASSSAPNRPRIAAAVDNLVERVITLPDINPTTGEYEPGQIWRMNLLQGAGGLGDYDRMRGAIRRGEKVARRPAASWRPM